MHHPHAWPTPVVRLCCRLELRADPWARASFTSQLSSQGCCLRWSWAVINWCAGPTPHQMLRECASSEGMELARLLGDAQRQRSCGCHPQQGLRRLQRHGLHALSWRQRTVSHRGEGFRCCAPSECWCCCPILEATLAGLCCCWDEFLEANMAVVNVESSRLII